MAIAAQDAQDRVEQLVVLTERLTSSVAQESAALDERRFNDAAKINAEAAPLAQLYRRESERAKAEPGMIRGAAADRRQALAQATEQLHATLAAHERALAGHRELTEGLVRSIAEYISEQRAENSGYGPGAQARSARAGSAVTLDARA